jgi:hypothetical protein
VTEDVLPWFGDPEAVRVLVRYCGRNGAAALWTGEVSGHPHSFSNSPGENLHWVAEEDLAKFRRLPDDFVVCDDTRVDPPRDRQRAIQLQAETRDRETRLQLEALQAQFTQLTAGVTAPVKAPSRRVGRPPRGDQDHLAYHLKYHCPDGWKLKDLAKKFITEDLGDPAAAMGRRLHRFAEHHPDLTDAERCLYCRDAECYPPDE